jgi:hypothetical protein
MMGALLLTARRRRLLFYARGECNEQALRFAVMISSINNNKFTRGSCEP